jgi:hypothetical protein
MAHVAFDTLKFVEKLKSAGISDVQAKALVEAQNEALGEALDNTLATKMDIAHIEAEIKLLKWMMGFVLAGIVTLIIKAFF